MFGIFSTIPSTKTYESKQHLYETSYARVRDIENSNDFGRYLELKTYVESAEYKNAIQTIRSLSYKASKEYTEEMLWKKLRKNKEVKEFLKKGVESDSDYVKKYIGLDEKLSSSVFLEQKAYLKNKNRHLDSEPYSKFKEYQGLQKSEAIKQYYQLQKKYAAVFVEMERWNTTFCEEFSDNKVPAQWDTKPHWTSAILEKNYSHNTEEHCLTEGKNIQVIGNVAQIVVRRESCSGTAWDEKMGFVPRDFSYTSGILSTAQKFQFGYGRLEAKLCIPNVKNIYSVFWLGSEKPTPAISVAHCCNKRLIMGAYSTSENASTTKKKGLLSDSNFYIFRLERTEKMLVWHINGKKMYECANPTKEPLYMIFTAGVIGKTNDNLLPSAFEIDYVKITELKK